MPLMRMLMPRMRSLAVKAFDQIADLVGADLKLASTSYSMGGRPRMCQPRELVVSADGERGRRL